MDPLAEEWDALFERLQTPEARAAVERLFQASSEELGQAAIAEAEHEGEAEGDE